MAAGANIGENFALFEPVHGSAPTRVGKHTANPYSMILSAKMMMEWMGERFGDEDCSKAAKAVEQAIIETFRKGITVPDYGGTANTLQVGEAIAQEFQLAS